MPRLDPIATIFSTLDRWRHLPAYQLERRADIFFAIYLRAAIEELVGEPLHDVVIPELPIKRDLIWPRSPTRKSVKVDYALFAARTERVYFVELKTDSASRRPEQDEYLGRAHEIGFQAIVGGIRDILLGTSAHRKYFHLASMLSELGFLRLPDDLADFLFPGPRPGLTQRLRQIEIVDRNPVVEPIFVQPTASASDRCLDFRTFADHVARHRDPFSAAFAEHLLRWVDVAGATPPARRRDRM